MPDDVALLRALRGLAASEAISTSELAEKTGLTPAELRTRVAALRNAGVPIEEVPGPDGGIRLAAGGPGDPLIADDLRARLPTDAGIGREIVVLAETGSTNDVVARASLGETQEGLVVFAECQRAGRGRQGRQWSSGRGLGLWFSILLQPAVAQSRWSGLALWAALGVAEAIEAETGLAPQIKWPNDILIAGRKVAGILIETHAAGADRRVACAVVGIGLNVSHQEADFPAELRDRAGSLAQAAGGRALDRPALAAALLGRLDALYRVWQTQPAAIVEACARRCHLRGRCVQAVDDPRLQGVVEGFDPEGRLLIRRPGEATLAVVTSGELRIV